MVARQCFDVCTRHSVYVFLGVVISVRRTIHDVGKLCMSAQAVFPKARHLLPTSPGGADSTNEATVASLEPILPYFESSERYLEISSVEVSCVVGLLFGCQAGELRWSFRNEDHKLGSRKAIAKTDILPTATTSHHERQTADSIQRTDEIARGLEKSHWTTSPQYHSTCRSHPKELLLIRHCSTSQAYHRPSHTIPHVHSQSQIARKHRSKDSSPQHPTLT